MISKYVNPGNTQGHRQGGNNQPPLDYSDHFAGLFLTIPQSTQDPIEPRYPNQQLQNGALQYSAQQGAQSKSLLVYGPPVQPPHQQSFVPRHCAAPRMIPQYIKINPREVLAQFPISALPKDFEVFVGNLPHHCKSEDLLEFFNHHYDVLYARVQRNKKDDSKRGPPMYGFVILTSAMQARNAIKYLNGHVFGGRRIRVERSDPTSPSALDNYESPTLYIRLDSLPLPQPITAEQHPCERKLRTFFSYFGMVEDVQLNMSKVVDCRITAYGFVKFERMETVHELVHRQFLDMDNFFILCKYNNKMPLASTQNTYWMEHDDRSTAAYSDRLNREIATRRFHNTLPDLYNSLPRELHPRMPVQMYGRSCASISFLKDLDLIERNAEALSVQRQAEFLEQVTGLKDVKDARVAAMEVHNAIEMSNAAYDWLRFDHVRKEAISPEASRSSPELTRSSSNSSITSNVGSNWSY